VVRMRNWLRFVRDWNQPWLAAPDESSESGGDVFAPPIQALETCAGDWTDWWSHGVASSAFETALNRKSHGRLFAARALSALLQGQPQPAAISTQR